MHVNICRSVKVKISNLNGVNYVLHVAHLFDKIIPAKSYHKVSLLLTISDFHFTLYKLFYAFKA